MTYWDPLSTFGFLAAHTARISLTTSVVVLGYHHPLDIAKRFGTLDRLSGGRLVLGVGVGSLKEEFDLLGATFDGRGEQADDAIRALRASLSTTRPSYRGSHYEFDGFAVEPCAVQERVPIPMEPYPTYADGSVHVIDRMIDTAPFVSYGTHADGLLTRLSTAALLNVTAGGGSQVPAFVVEAR